MRITIFIWIRIMLIKTQNLYFFKTSCLFVSLVVLFKFNLCKLRSVPFWESLSIDVLNLRSYWAGFYSILCNEKLIFVVERKKFNGKLLEIELKLVTRCFGRLQNDIIDKTSREILWGFEAMSDILYCYVKRKPEHSS